MFKFWNLLLGCMLVIGHTIYGTSDCSDGWFGSRCQFQCHCSDKICSNNGTCSTNSSCQPGWFGATCQFIDLVPLATVRTFPTSSISDGLQLCLGNVTVISAIIELAIPFPVTWLRVGVAAGGSVQNIKVEFASSFDTPPFSCINQSTSVITDTMIDIHCENSEAVKTVTVTGDRAKSLCSVQVNGVCPVGQFGDMCSGRCNKNCGGSGSCFTTNEACSDGCRDGYTGVMCSEKCFKSYGPDCEFNCSRNCQTDESIDPAICHHITGACFLGCRNGYHGIMCNEKSPFGISELAFAVVITVSIAVVIIIIIILLACCYIRRTRISKTAAAKLDKSYDTLTENGTDVHSYEALHNSDAGNQSLKPAELCIVMLQVTEGDTQHPNIYESNDENTVYYQVSEDTDVSQKKLSSDSSETEVNEYYATPDGGITTQSDDATYDKVYEIIKL